MTVGVLEAAAAGALASVSTLGALWLAYLRGRRDERLLRGVEK